MFKSLSEAMAEFAIRRAEMMAKITELGNDTPVEELLDKVLEKQPPDFKKNAFMLLGIYRLMGDFEQAYNLTSDPTSNKARQCLVDLVTGNMLSEHALHINFIVEKATMIQDLWIYFLEMNNIPLQLITTFPDFDRDYFLENIANPITSGIPFRYKRPK